MNKQSDEVIHQMEEEDRHPRVSLLEKELNTQLLEERYLRTIPLYRRVIYRMLPVELTQIIETLVIQKHYDAVLSYYERVGLPLALMQKILRLKTPHVLLTSWLSSRTKRWFVKRVHQSLAKIITWSSKQRDFAINQLGVTPAKIKLVKYGVDQNFWRPMNVQTDMICSVGMEMRDYPTLIEALKSTQIPCHIAVSKSSRGQIYDTVRQLYDIEDVGAYVSIGYKNYPELRKLYARSRFVVIPLLQTDTDNGLTVMLEAMAMGKTVICSQVEGQIDVIQDGVTGTYVPQGDPVALREAIVNLWNHPAKAIEMGKDAREYILKEHTLEQFVNDIKGEVEKAARLKPRNYIRLGVGL